VSAPAVDELLARDRWSRDRLLEEQRRRLTGLLEHAVSASPYYRQTLGRAALAENVSLDQLPTLSKEMLMAQFDRVVADPRLRLAALEAHATGDDPAALFARAFHVFSTSGTTGRRGVFPQLAAEFDQWLAAAWRMRHRLGLDAGVRVVGIGAPTPLHVTQKLFTAFGAYGNGRPTLTANTPLPEIVATLNRDRPDAIITGAGMAALLAEEQLEGRLSIEPSAVLLAGEVLAEDVARRIDDAWGITPCQVYGSTEALVLASESSDRVGLHVSEDLLVLESRRRGRPARASGRPRVPCAADEPRQPRAAPDQVRAVRLRHARSRTGS
jgi:phenylacetate-coenzyme A ligase PaaK-like adenylate-forming protein